MPHACAQPFLRLGLIDRRCPSVAGERQYEANVYGGMQQQAMSSKLRAGEKVKSVQAEGAECYVGAFIESRQSGHSASWRSQAAASSDH